jgi:hypothetical protein
MNRLLYATATALILAAVGSGCCCMDRYYHGDCNRLATGGLLAGTRCGSGGCGGGECGGSECGAGECGRGGLFSGRQRGSQGCAGGACQGGECNDCNSCGSGCQPLRNLWGMLFCSKGCGEFYFDEWINDPPDRCDPCDQHGGYVGHQPCRRWFLGGRSGCCGRYADSCDTSCGFEAAGHCGCTSGAHGDGHYTDEVMGGETVPAPEPDMMQPGGMQPEAMQPEMMDQASVVRRPAKTTYKTPASNRRASYSQPSVKSKTVARTSHEVTPATPKAAVGSGVRKKPTQTR